jgi:SAM-dependent methyltransferase
VRVPLELNDRLFALVYPRIMARSENAGQRETRRELVGEAQGRTLELGAGSGLNLPHYTSQVDELFVSEPSPHMMRHLRELLDADPPAVGSWKLLEAGAEQIPFEDQSFDTVVATFVFCTIPDPAQALIEVARVLRPGGRFLFLEHVRAEDGTGLGRLQDLAELPHRFFAGGCHPNRRTGELIAASPLEVERLDHGTMPRGEPLVKPTIIGSARRGGTP